MSDPSNKPSLPNYLGNGDSFAPAMLIVVVAVWCLLVAFTPWSVGWRDSGEFLITAYFLDIPHPAGFPTYSMLANLFTGPLFGPIAWRTHLFASACSCCLLYQTYRLTLQASGLNKISLIGKVIAAVAALSLILTEPFLRGSLTAEVYVLHALLLVIITRLLLSYVATRDLRLLFTASFIGGIAVGNHVVAVLTALWFAALWLPTRYVPLRAAGLSIVFALAGLCVYSYLPVRSLAHPPLNTGDPHSPLRFFRQLTDARDSALRVDRPVSNTPSNTRASIIPERLQRFSNDVHRLLNLLPLSLSLFGVAGFLIGCIQQPRIFSLLAGLFFPTLFFFASWDPDPWLPALVCCVAAAGAMGVRASMCMGTSSVARCLILVTILIDFALITPAAIRAQLAVLNSQSSFQLPVESAERLLGAVPRHGLLISEPSWFIVRYLQTIEGARSDTTSVYVPSLLFPHYFNPARLKIGDGVFEGGRGVAPAEPNLSNLWQLISRTSSVTPILLEPTQSYVLPLREMLFLDPFGNFVLDRSQSSPGEHRNVTARAQLIRHIYLRSKTLQRTLQADTVDYATVLFAQTMSALDAIGDAALFCEFGGAVCGQSTDLVCPRTVGDIVAVRCGVAR